MQISCIDLTNAISLLKCAYIFPETRSTSNLAGDDELAPTFKCGKELCSIVNNVDTIRSQLSFQLLILFL